MLGEVDNLLDGRLIASGIYTKLRTEVDWLKARGITPKLTIILLGDDPASHSYVRAKQTAAGDIGLLTELILLDKSTTREDLIQQIISLNKDESVHGILVQLPLPRHIDPDQIICTIAIDKDVDGFHPYNVGLTVTGQGNFAPCTPAGIMELLARTKVDLTGKHAVVVGRSNIVGKPIAQLLQQANATVTMCHSQTVDLAHHTTQADILVVAVGSPKLIGEKHVKPGAVVIDVGVNRQEGRLVGDVDFAAVSPLAQMITPVPGGVGPMTVAMLMKNVVHAAKKTQQ